MCVCGREDKCKGECELKEKGRSRGDIELERQTHALAPSITHDTDRRTDTWRDTDIETQTPTYRNIHTDRYTCTQRQTDTSTHTNTHTHNTPHRTHIDTHTHTHTHTLTGSTCSCCAIRSRISSALALTIQLRGPQASSCSRVRGGLKPAGRGGRIGEGRGRGEKGRGGRAGQG